MYQFHFFFHFGTTLLEKNLATKCKIRFNESYFERAKSDWDVNWQSKKFAHLSRK